MARRAVVELVDDIDGTVFGDEGESINYAVDGVEYEIDLKGEHAKEFRDALDYWIAHSRRVGGRKRRSNRVTDPIGSTPRTGEVKKIREWATEQGYEMPSRGRIRAEIVQAFHDAH
ncbi:Lsr2 family protein [Rhodococcus opacus]|nr:Lsr2 family protein [Rhodococcus opacus]